MWSINYGFLLTILTVNEVASKFYPILPKYDQNIVKNQYKRYKRQFEFQPPFGENNGFGFDSENNGIFFDEDNMFQDTVGPVRPGSNQNNAFQNNPDFFGRGQTQNEAGLNNPTTQRPLGVTAVNIPGMGTTRSTCEDNCLTTPQYNPVCGDNNVTYNNVERFKCAVRCGRNVKIAAYRACPRIMVK